MAREYFVIALAAPDPHAALEIARERTRDPRYESRQFRAYVQGLKRAAARETIDDEEPDGESSQPVERTCRLEFIIPEHVARDWNEVVVALGMSSNPAFVEAVSILHRMHVVDGNQAKLCLRPEKALQVQQQRDPAHDTPQANPLF